MLLRAHPCPAKVQQYRNSVGKNSSDRALIIDAMDLLHSGRFAGFCLVSSDGDCTRLATRIREDGLRMYGYGRNDAAKSFVNACERFTYIEHLLEPTGRATLALDSEEASKTVEPATLPTAGLAAAAVVAAPLDPLRLQTQLLRAHANVAEEDGWALMARVAQYVRANQSDFDPRHHGASSFSRLLEASAVFDVVVRKKGYGQTHFCRPKKTLTQPIVVHHLDRAVAADYVQALSEAVSRSQGPDGWSSAVAIGKQLKAMGREIKDSGCATLHEALAAAGLFEMRDTDGARKEFRLKAVNCG
ncbi:MAG TPA: NYN domain-containing protein [Accumulibacter sp.]|uniref:NYN domain-containing protein n=1 Tax=Accumulibacter sp. TaxID=2053492 RepID=UPI002B54D82D|nr:NYN domain-containing protein [Accumulibacter sp.]HRD88255.1 NYN domain-containing protein [Accumulibacter sp.]